MSRPNSILITGASSGLGAAMARVYAGDGVTLFLHGRNRERLESVAAACQKLGANVAAEVGDVTDRDHVAAWVGAADADRPLDLVIANAGVSAGTAEGDESDAQARLIFDTNFGGVLNTVEPAIERMAARKSGQIAIMSSLASFFGFAGAPAYCASKAAARLWGEGLRDSYRGRVAVSVICPGFVRTPLTEVNQFPMPGLMDVDRAATIIRRGLDADRARIAFPLSIYLGARLLAVLPDRATREFLARFPRKPSRSP